MRGAREHLPASKARARRRRGLYLRLSVGVFLLALLIGGLSALSYARAWRIATVAVVGADTIAPADIQAQVAKELTGSYFFLVPKDNVLLYPKESAIAGLYAAFPKLRSADIRFRDFKTIEVMVVEREPTSVWCGESRTLHSSCYFMDTVGLLYAKAPEFSGPIYVTYYGALSSPEPLTTSFLGRDAFKSLAALVTEMGKESQPVSVEVTASDDVFVSFVDGHRIFFARKDAPEDVLSRLAHARESGDLSGVALSSIDYIDVRFGNRVYFKLKGE